MSEPYLDPYIPYLEVPRCVPEKVRQGRRGAYVRVFGVLYLRDPETGDLIRLPLPTLWQTFCRFVPALFCGAVIGAVVMFFICLWGMPL